MKSLKNKRGDSYIYLCVIVVFVCLLVSVIILYTGLIAQVQIQKRDVQAKLDSYVSSRATDEYDALKQGSVKDNYFEWNQIEAEAYKALGFPNESDEVYVYENGNCTMTRPTVTILKGDGFGVTVEYVAIFPITWNGTVFIDLEIPVTVTSYYKTR